MVVNSNNFASIYMRFKNKRIRFIRVVILLNLFVIFNILSLAIKAPYFYLNTSNSLPLGVYVVKKSTGQIGDLAVIDLSESQRQLLISQNIKKLIKLLIKPIIAVSGDVVCNKGKSIVINEQINLNNCGNHSLYNICRKLNNQEFFVGIFNQNNSIDSRYFGPITNKEIKTVVRPFMVVKNIRDRD